MDVSKLFVSKLNYTTLALLTHVQEMVNNILHTTGLLPFTFFFLTLKSFGYKIMNNFV